MGEAENHDVGSGPEDGTLGGYVSVHNRPPAFEGVDGHPYTVSIETERLPELRDPIGAFLVFPRWALTGLGIIGHVESTILWRGPTVSDAVGKAESTPLADAQRILNELIVARAQEERADGDPLAEEGSP